MQYCLSYNEAMRRLSAGGSEDGERLHATAYLVEAY
jgi:hypothetical protein